MKQNRRTSFEAKELEGWLIRQLLLWQLHHMYEQQKKKTLAPNTWAVVSFCKWGRRLDFFSLWIIFFFSDRICLNQYWVIKNMRIRFPFPLDNFSFYNQATFMTEPFQLSMGIQTLECRPHLSQLALEPFVLSMRTQISVCWSLLP